MVYRARYSSKDRLILVEPSQANAATCALPMTTATRGKTHEMKEGRKEGKSKRRNISQHATRRRGTRVVFVASHCTCYCNGMCPVATKCRQNVKLLFHKQLKTPVSTDTYIETITTLNIDMRILAD